ncbi:hypothetical protein FIBSPDRAFT_864505 [Athelia psychrophila]|uniref:Uncharacterized protein n=1 Tax=Athelia psychrophila TaxID=1759441 RepID=A0A166GIJ2_9AGAM|nr:hypothetical protein FIBSPDRAFT_864505 [Fibularhizoctonia sp. CBS 109695]
MTVVTLPDLERNALASLAGPELKRRTVLAARVEHQWGHSARVAPGAIRSFPTRDGPSRVIKAKLVRGGQWIVLLLKDGTMCLQAATASAPCVVDHSFKARLESDVRITLSLSAGSPKETLVLLRTWMWDASRGSPSTAIAIYRVDTVKLCFRLLMEVTRYHSRAFDNSAVAEGNLWAFGWPQQGRQLLSVKNILWNKDDVEKEVVLDIGEPIHATLSILSETQILVTSCYKASLYEIPPLRPILLGQQSPVGPVYWDASSSRHERSLAMLTGTALRVFSQTSEHISMDSFLIRKYGAAEMEARPVLSDRQAIWSTDRKLFVCTFPMRSESDAGRLRLGGLEPGSEPRVAPVEMPAGSVDGQIQDLWWDEAAGRLCLLVEFQRPGSKVRGLKIVIIDTM